MSDHKPKKRDVPTLIHSAIATGAAHHDDMAEMRDRAGEVMAYVREKLNRKAGRERISQRELAAMLDVSHTYISKIEAGKERAGVPFLRKLAELMAEAKEPPSAPKAKKKAKKP